jgi:hypothetical protein
MNETHVSSANVGLVFIPSVPVKRKRDHPAMISEAETDRVDNGRTRATISCGQGGGDRPQGLVPGVPLAIVPKEQEVAAVADAFGFAHSPG